MSVVHTHIPTVYGGNDLLISYFASSSELHCPHQPSGAKRYSHHLTAYNKNETNKRLGSETFANVFP